MMMQSDDYVPGAVGWSLDDDVQFEEYTSTVEAAWVRLDHAVRTLVRAVMLDFEQVVCKAIGRLWPTLGDTRRNRP